MEREPTLEEYVRGFYTSPDFTEESAKEAATEMVIKSLEGKIRETYRCLDLLKRVLMGTKI